MVKKRRKTLVHHYYCSSSNIALSCRQRHNFAIRFRKSIPTPSIGEIFFLGFLFFLLAILVLPMSATENKRVKCAIYYLGGTIYFTLTQFFSSATSECIFNPPRSIKRGNEEVFNKKWHFTALILFWKGFQFLGSTQLFFPECKFPLLGQILKCITRFLIPSKL